MVTCVLLNSEVDHVHKTSDTPANTAADHLDVLSEAIALVPARHRRQLLIRGDSAAATHVVLDWLTGQNTTRRRVQ